MIEGLCLLIKKYLISNKQEVFEEILEYESGMIYSLIYSLLKRNGIYRDRLSNHDFCALLFIVLKEHSIELTLFSSSSRYFETISRITNLILKRLNKTLYRENKIKKCEIELSIDIKEEPEYMFDIVSEAEKLLQNMDYKDATVIRLYFGINRKRLEVDEICKILNVKRSTAFVKISNFKKTLAKELN